jgi:divalent metal cation (Fe/Co/Zn/Cd) transporter
MCCNNFPQTWLTIRKRLFELDFSDIAIIRRYIDEHSTNLASNMKKSDAEFDYGARRSLSISSAMYVSGIVVFVTVSFSMLINFTHALFNLPTYAIQFYENTFYTVIFLLLCSLIIIFLFLSILFCIRGLIQTKAYEKRKQNHDSHNQIPK